MITKVGELALWLEEAVHGFADRALVAVSGGVDSAVVAAICISALGSENVSLLYLPDEEQGNSPARNRAKELAEFYRAALLDIDLRSLIRLFLGATSDMLGQLSGDTEELHALTRENARARIRSALLYALSGEISYREQERLFPEERLVPVRGQTYSTRVRVIGTENASERLIGYGTKWGSAYADIFPLGDLFKSEVYQLAQFYRVPPAILRAAPAKPLFKAQPGEKDYAFEDLEPALVAISRALARGVKEGELQSTLDEFAKLDKRLADFTIRRYLANVHKRHRPFVVSVRNTELVRDLWE